jgi:tetratricopeptide (TPR) repeat protein
MATRVNTKFVLILVVTLFAAAGIVGGLWLLQIRSDTARNIKAGDTNMAQGRAARDRGDAEASQAFFEQALKQYGRAVRKEAAELSHLHKLEAALTEIRPTTRDRANELNGLRLEIMRHQVRYRRQDPEVHLRLINELYGIARLFNETGYWQELADAADDMQRNVSDFEPDYNRALLYRGMGRMRAMGLAGLGAIPTRTGTQEDFLTAEDDLLKFIEAFEHDDLGWAVFAESRLSLARQRRADGLLAEAKEKYELASEALRQAVEAVPDGPEVARVVAMELALRRQSDPDAFDQEALQAAADRLETLVKDSDDPLLLADVTEILRAAYPKEGLDRSIELMGRYVDAHPDMQYQRLQYALLCYTAREHEEDYLDEALAAATTIIDAEHAPVSTLSTIQDMLRVRAAGLMVDVAYRRWIYADDADKAVKLAALEKARDDLKKFVADPDGDATLVNAEGKIAAAKGDFAEAADYFERALKLSAVDDFDTLWNAARCLEQIGQYGKACERFGQAFALRPSNVLVLTEKARLEFRIGRNDDARESVLAVLGVDPENEQARRLLIAIESTDPTARPEQVTDQAAQRLLLAQEAADEGELDAARSILAAALAEATDKLPVLSELIQLEVRAGRIEEAVAYLDQALEIQPANQFLRRLRVSLITEDQIEALKLYLADVYEDEADRTIHTVIQLNQLAREMDSIAARQDDAGDEEKAAHTRSRAEVARNEAEQFLARAKAIAPSHATLIDHLFNEAVLAGDEQALADLAEQARATNADQAGGLIYKGRLEMFRAGQPGADRQEYERAAQTLTEATDRKNYSALAWRLLGRCYERLGNFPEALRAYEEAYTCNPNDRYVVRWYVTLLIQTGDRTRALRHLRAARRTVEGDKMLQELRLQLEAASGNLALAIQERRWMYQQAPENRSNAMRLVALLSKSKPTFEHILDEQGVPRFDAARWGMLSDQDRRSALERVATQWKEESEYIIAALEAEGGGDVMDELQVAALRAEVLKARGDVRGGEQVLRDFCDRNPSVMSLLVLGRFQANTEHFDAATATFEAARVYQDEDRREADHALADLKFNQNLWQQAMERYRDLTATGPAEHEVLLRLTECHLKLQQYEEASSVLERAIEEGGQDFYSAMLSAGVSEGHADQLSEQGKRTEADQKYAEASAALDDAERLAPRSPLPYVRRAQRLLNEYAKTARTTLLDDATLQLDRAEEAAAGHETISSMRVEIYRIKNDQRGAMAELNRLLARNPGSVPARKLLVQLYAQAGNRDGAMATIDEAIRLNPTLALWHEAKGDLFVILSQIDAATPEFREAYELQPTGGRLAKYAETALASTPPANADVVALVSSAPQLVDGRPLLRGLYARALGGVGRYDEALAQMRAAHEEHFALKEEGRVTRAALVNWLRALQVVMAARPPAEYEQFVTELSGGQPEPTEMLWIARSWVTSGDEGLSRGIELVRMGLSQCPAEDTALLAQLELDLGQFEVLAGNIRAAVEAFERALEIEPANVLALNNAAYIYVEHIGDAAKALPYAERAAEQAPNQSTVLDTLGWTYYRLGRFAEAEESLRLAFKIRPTADICFHLARVLFDTAKGLDPQPAAQRLATARTYLRRSAELQPTPELQMEIDRLAEEIEATGIRPGGTRRR